MAGSGVSVWQQRLLHCRLAGGAWSAPYHLTCPLGRHRVLGCFGLAIARIDGRQHRLGSIFGVEVAQDGGNVALDSFV